MNARKGGVAVGVAPTSAQLTALDAINAFRNRHRLLPTLAELACELGRTKSAAFQVVRRLKCMGLLESTAGAARNLVLTRKGASLIAQRARAARQERAA